MESAMKAVGSEVIVSTAVKTAALKSPSVSSSTASSLPHHHPHPDDACSSSSSSSGVLWGHRRALIGNAATAGFMVTALGLTIKRGKALGFRKLFHSVSAPKDVVYIGVLYGLGDVSQQLITQTRRNLAKPLEDRDWSDLSVDWKGVTSAGLVGGTVIGTFNHYWYTFLDKFIRGTSFKSVAKKVFLDQMSLPVPIAAFFIAMSIVKAKPDVFEELKAKFLTTYLYGSILWPTTQFFNFMFVPRFHRILFIGCVEFVWTNVMCFMFDLEIDKDDPLSHLD